jgi:hypothetical protein
MSTATELPESPSLDQLAERKELAYAALFQAQSAAKIAWREIAHQESLVSAYLIGLNRPEEAVMNLNAEANALIQAGEYVEASAILQKAVDTTHNPRIKSVVLSAMATISGFVDSLKHEKSLKEVLELVDSMGGTLSASADGTKGGTRFCEFNYQGQFFHVDISTVYHITKDDDTEGFDVTTLDRLEVRLNESIEKAAIASRVEAELAEDDYEDEDDDDDEF